MPKTHLYPLNLSWVGPEKGSTRHYRSYDRGWRVKIPGKADLLGSADATFRGDASAHNPEDLMVVALSSCHMLSFLAICAHRGIEILAYEDDALGYLSPVDKGLQFTKVELRPRIQLADEGNRPQIDGIHKTAHSQCFIARSVNFPVVILPPNDDQE